ncbi:putative wall-associated receptor kinase-like 16 [Bienertia sinuspersici]
MGQVQTKNKKRIKSLGKLRLESKEYFIKYGGILLEKQISLSQGRDTEAGQLKNFSLKDIKKATNNLDPVLLKVSSLGSNFNSNFYIATVEDRNLVFGISLQTEPDPELIDRILTNAAIIMVMNHENMVRLYGCCLETAVPILVYLLVPNGGLFQYLHCDIASGKRIKWADLLRVATDVAYALSYLHNALLKPVVHRDVNSSSVLLDCSFRAKLANFGHAVSITPGEKPEKLPVEGTPGYIDPEYIETQEVTVKCDVYSFGVFVLELLTRKQPLMMARDGVDLVDVFVSAVKKNCMMRMIDRDVLEQASCDEIQRVARLALTCTEKKGDERPTMVDVVGELWSIQGRNKK